MTTTNWRHLKHPWALAVPHVFAPSDLAPHDKLWLFYNYSAVVLGSHRGHVLYHPVYCINSLSICLGEVTDGTGEFLTWGNIFIRQSTLCSLWWKWKMAWSWVWFGCLAKNDNSIRASLHRKIKFMCVYDTSGLMQKRYNSIANALELHLSCIKPSKPPIFFNPLCAELKCFLSLLAIVFAQSIEARR